MIRKLIYKPLISAVALTGALLMPAQSIDVHAESNEAKPMKLHHERQTSLELLDSETKFQRFTYDSGLQFDYPDAVRGIYVTGPSAGGSRFEGLVDLVDTTDLNAMVIDIKEDHGNLTYKPEEGSPFEDIALNYMDDPRKMLEVLEEKGIYPIARIVVFKDSVLAKKRPELSFKENGKVWVNNKGEAFVNPFMKEVWEYNVDIAEEAAKLGFKEIQFDYVRFPEGFERYADRFDYSLGEYADFKEGEIKQRVEAVTDFVSYARKELEYYDVDVAVDIFGYAADVVETPGIGQNFLEISENVDVISSMIYPSHWGNNYFGIPMPDKEPYRLVTEYAKVENDLLAQLGDKSPTSRPWLQDFEAPWLYSGPTKQYGKAEVEAQIKALNENGIDEFLLWNSGNTYTKNVDYTP
ncbi:hypothetical protein JNUCC1_00321 [Lentibacillus sp. JNUCC-1]|uniref:putative glycoside hydrolase n=1 Tax=Lentibacillus sp. JNUCC-1 TaxID=2654513 RepID=UPI0012E83F95|nr:hypothetical protein [Lentibacillus sp. JNUCC-1]